MKKITFGLFAISALTILSTGCKKTPNAEPEPDKEFQSSIDVVQATSMLTEVEDIVAHAGDGYTELTSKYFNTTNTTLGNAVVAVTGPSIITVTYNGTVTCLDGKKRSGSIIIDRTGSTNQNAVSYRDPGYVAKVTFNLFKVDGIQIANTNPSNPLKITNNTPGTNFNKAVTPLTWKIDASLWMAKGLDSTTWIGSIDKKLANSTNSLILGGTSQNTTKILWSLNSSPTAVPNNTNSTLGAIVEYKMSALGNIKKSTVSNIGYKLETKKEGENNQAVREFFCSPEKVVISSVPTLTTLNQYIGEFHPFISGVVSCTVDAKDEPRVIDFKGDNPGCDNSGVITIKGISYAVDFKK